MRRVPQAGPPAKCTAAHVADACCLQQTISGMAATSGIASSHAHALNLAPSLHMYRTLHMHRHCKCTAHSLAAAVEPRDCYTLHAKHFASLTLLLPVFVRFIPKRFHLSQTKRFSALPRKPRNFTSEKNAASIPNLWLLRQASD